MPKLFIFDQKNYLMIIYIKGYYWYKNLGDELLLFWVLKRVSQKFDATKILIEAGDVTWLSFWLEQNKRALPNIPLEVVWKRWQLKHKKDIVIFWWWEVVTDARPFPYNWWTYVLWFLKTIISKKYYILGGVWTVKNKTTPLLYKIFLGRAKKIVVRDSYSLKVTKRFNTNTELYKDFCYDFLELYAENFWLKNKKKNTDSLLINTNKYIRNKETKELICDQAKEKSSLYYLPWELWTDDTFFSLLKKELPTLEILDWTKMSVKELLQVIQSSEAGIWARLHVLLLLDYFWVPYTPLIYQEKITHVLWVKKW